MFPTGSFSISKNCLASRDSCCSARKVSFCFMMSKCHSIEGKKKQKNKTTYYMGRKGTFLNSGLHMSASRLRIGTFVSKLCVCSENWFNFCLTPPLCVQTWSLGVCWGKAFYYLSFSFFCELLPTSQKCWKLYSQHLCCLPQIQIFWAQHFLRLTS